jgi:hypothetical protein
VHQLVNKKFRQSKMYIGLQVKFAFLVRLQTNTNFPDRFFFKLQTSNMKIRPARAEYFHGTRTDTQAEGTYVMKLIVTSRNFAQLPENQNPGLKLHHKAGHKNLTGIYVLNKQNILDTQSGSLNEQLYCGW